MVTILFGNLRGGDEFIYQGDTYIKLRTEMQVRQGKCCSNTRLTKVNAMNADGSLVFFKRNEETCPLLEN